MPACCACRTTSWIFLQLGRRRAERDRARHVGVVAAEQRAEVHLDHVALFEQPVRGLVVRLGGVLAERHDRVERRARRRRRAGSSVLQLPGDLAARSCRPRSARGCRSNAASVLACASSRIASSSVVLHPPQALDRVAHAPRARRRRARPASRSRVAHGDLVRLEPEPRMPSAAQRLRERLAERVRGRSRARGRATSWRDCSVYRPSVKNTARRRRTSTCPLEPVKPVR